MAARNRNLVIRLDDDEHAMARALSDATKEPVTIIVRRLLRAEYRERFAVAPPPPRPSAKARGSV